MGEPKKPISGWQYAFRLDCAANGCAKPHRDDGRIFDIGSQPPHHQEINEHAATVVRRRIGAWEVVKARSPCAGTTSHGKPCRRLSDGDSAYCFAHDPEKESEREMQALLMSKSAKRRAKRRPTWKELSDD